MELFATPPILVLTFILARTVQRSVALSGQFSFGRFPGLKPWAVLSNHFMVQNRDGHGGDFLKSLLSFLDWRRAVRVECVHGLQTPGLAFRAFGLVPHHGLPIRI